MGNWSHLSIFYFSASFESFLVNSCVPQQASFEDFFWRSVAKKEKHDACMGTRTALVEHFLSGTYAVV
jgi:hypothetical protein